jgi:hypothetical protein
MAHGGSPLRFAFQNPDLWARLGIDRQIAAIVKNTLQQERPHFRPVAISLRLHNRNQHLHSMP